MHKHGLFIVMKNFVTWLLLSLSIVNIVCIRFIVCETTVSGFSLIPPGALSTNVIWNNIFELSFQGYNKKLAAFISER